MTAVGARARGREAFWPAFAALVGGAFAMGASPIFVRLADVGPFASAFYRVLLALPLLYAWMRAEAGQGAAPTTGPRFTGAMVLSGLLFAGDLFFWHLASLNTTVANATFFATTAPIWVGIFGWLVLRKRVGSATIAGLLLCLLGGAALVWQSLAFAPEHLTGDFYGAMTGLFFGAYFLAVARARERHGAGWVSFHATVVTATSLSLAALWGWLVLHQPLFPGSLKGWMVLVALAWVSHCGGQGMLAIALGSLPTLFSSLVIFLEALAAAGLGWLVLDEAVTPLQGLGGLVILAGIWVARPKDTHRPEDETKGARA